MLNGFVLDTLIVAGFLLTGAVWSAIVDAFDGASGDDGGSDFVGGPDDDTFIGTDAADVMDGGGGNDILDGLGGDDLLLGGTGLDEIFGRDGNDIISGGQNNDLLYGGGGQDSLSGGRGDDALYGGAGRDLLVGNGGDDVLNGVGGSDRLFGSTGDDVLLGGAGGDHLFGGAGNDVLRGQMGDDELFGGAGERDELYGGNGNDVLYGGAANAGLVANNRLDGGVGDDTLILRGADRAIGGDGSDGFHLLATSSEPSVTPGSGGAVYATIGDYDPAHDTITIDYDPADYAGVPSVSVSIVGSTANIFLNLQWIAEVANAPGLTAGDIAVAPDYDAGRGLTSV